jgi:lipoprotein-releasing system permease protein
MNKVLPFEWIAAIRFLREGRMQTAFIILGVTIGVAVIVFMSALLSALQVNFLKQVQTSIAQVELLPLDQIARPLRGSEKSIEDAAVQRPAQRIVSIDQWQTIRDSVAQMPGVLIAAPTMSGSALVTRGDASRAISVSGVEPDTYFKIIRVADFLVSGKATFGSDEIMVGTDLATNLGASLGDKVRLRAASGNAVILRITGLFDFGNKAANERVSFVALRTAQSLLGQAGAVTTIEIKTADVFAAERIARQIAAAHPVKAESWIATNAQFFSALSAQQLSSTLIRAFVGISVAFGIAAVLVVSVIQRSKDIGIMRAMGTTRGQVLRIFLIQGGILGFVGAVVGSAVGIGGLAWFHSLIRQADGTELFPFLIERQIIAITLVIATLTGLLAATAPALRAARLDPAVAIRG